MSTISKSFQGVRTRLSLRHDAPGPVGLTAGAAALAVVVAATVGSISAADPAPYAQPAAVTAETTAAPVAQAAPFPAPAQPVVVPAIAPAPAPAPPPPPPAPPAPVYENNLDGWIRQAMDILNAHGIPASYEGIHRNILRESSGNPGAINLYDSNAAAGIPSKGLLQVIDPTFAAFHIDGTAFDVWDPVANIVAACNYAAHRYGSMDNVNSAY